MITIRKEDTVDVYKGDKFQFTGVVKELYAKTATVKHNNKKDNHIVPITNLKKVFNVEAAF